MVFPGTAQEEAMRISTDAMARSLVAGLLAMIAVVFSGATAIGSTVLLTITNPTLPAGPREIRLTEADLKALPQVTVRTGNEFVSGVPRFVGPLARDVVGLLGRGHATVAKLTAANDFAVEIDLAEFQQYDVILAMEQDGRPLSRRDKGPIWLIYPMDDHVNLQDPIYNNRLIWQLVRIELK
jgi:hypothetical protein